MSLKLIFLFILNVYKISFSICSEKRFLLPSLSKITNVSLRIDSYDYENFYGHNDCKSDSNCADPNSICVNGACVFLCSYSDWIKNSKNCIFYHCDSKYLITPNDYDSIFQKYKPIETNNFPILNRYLNGKKCSWVLLNTNFLNNSAMEKSFINLNFDRFSTRFASDFLYIFSGDSVYSPIVAILSGPEIAGQDPSVQPIYIEKEQLSTDKNQSTNLTLFNATKLFLTFKTDVFSSLLASQSIYASDSKHSKGISIQYKFSKKCDLHGLSEPNPVSVCHDTLEEQQLENLDRLNVQSDLVETIHYQNTDSQNILEKKINRAYHCSFLFNSYFYIIGGLSYSEKISFVSRLNLKSFEWEHYIDRSSSTVVNRSNRNFFANSSNHEKPKEAIPQNRYSHSCVLDQENKRVFMFGGIIYEKNDKEMIKKQTTSELWIFNLETNKWSILSGENGSKKDYELPISVTGHSMHLIKRSKTESSLLIFFGYSEFYGSLLYIIQEFNLVTNKWSYNQTSYLSIGFGHSSHYDIRTNVIYFHGGLIPDSDRYSAYRNFDSASLSPFIYSFSLNSHTWTELTKSPEAYYMHSSVFYNNKILFYGGISQSENFQKSLSNSNIFRFYETIKNNFVEEFSIYDPENTQKFRVKFRQRFAHSVFVHENFMYIFGGFNGFWLGDMFRINLANIQEVQRVHTNFRRKRDKSKFLSDSEDFFGNKISSLNDIDFVADYEIPNELSNRQISQIEMCSSHMNCNSCQLNTNCIWNGNVCEYFTSIDLTVYKKPSCLQMCSQYTSCSNCTNSQNFNGQYQSNCIWCASQSKCVQKKAVSILYPFGECHDLVDSRDKCEKQTREVQTGLIHEIKPCSALHSNCSSCITDERCGWCTKDTQGDGALNTGFGKCLEGGELKSLNKECVDNWFFSSCPSCECNGHSTCSNSSACTKCMNNTQGAYCSVCKFGFFGKAINNGLCESCECGEQASDCDKSSGKCFCDTKGVIGDKCDACDSPRYFGLPNMTEGSCYYNLTTDYQFTFNLNKDSDRYLTKINFVNHPTRGSDDDIDFMIRCYRTTAVVDVSFVIEDFSYSSYDSFVVPDYNQNALSIEFLSNFSLVLKNSTLPTTTDESSNQQNSLVFDTSKFYFGRMPKFNKILKKVNCSNEEFKHTFTNNELNYADENRNLLFIVNAYSFKTPITIQIAFSRKTKIHLLHFFITFFGCLLSLLTIAFITWKSKQRLDRYRRQRQIVIQMEHMASRPFTRLFLDISEGSKEEAGCSKLENQEPVKEKKASRLSFKKSEKKAKFLRSLEFEAEVENGGDSHPKVMPIGVEPLSNNKSAIVTCLLRLPQGGSKSIPKGSSLFMLGSTYINLNSSSNVVPHGSSDIHMNNDESDDEQEAEKNFV